MGQSGRVLLFLNDQAAAHDLDHPVCAALECITWATGYRPVGTTVLHRGCAIGIPGVDMHNFADIQIDVPIGIRRWA